MCINIEMVYNVVFVTIAIAACVLYYELCRLERTVETLLYKIEKICVGIRILTKISYQVDLDEYFDKYIEEIDEREDD